MAEFHGLEVTTMFAADSDLEFRPRRAPFVYTHLDEHANADLVQTLEWICLEDAGLFFVDIVG